MLMNLLVRVRALILTVALVLAGSLTVNVGVIPISQAQAANAVSPYCTAGSTYVGGFCVPAGGFGGGPCAFDNLSLNVVGYPSSACGQASGPAFSATIFSNLQRSTSALANDLIQQRIQCLLDPQLRACRKLKGKKRYSADMPDDSDADDNDTGPSYGVWANGFGDYERDFTTQTLNAAAFAQPLTNSMTTTMGGAVVGADVSWSGVWSANDELVLGIDGTIENSQSKMALSTDKLSGGAIGVYGSYAFGGFTFETEDKIEFLHLNSTFLDPLGASPARAAAGSFGTQNVNYDSDNSLSYRFNKNGPGWFIEPTIGVEFTRSTFQNAAILGLNNGTTIQGRAGFNFGTKYTDPSQNMTIDSKFTVLAFSDLMVSTGTTLVVDLTNPVQSIDTTQGKLRAKFAADETFSFANGFSVEAKGEYRVGSDLQGVGGELTLRYDF